MCRRRSLSNGNDSEASQTLVKSMSGKEPTAADPTPVAAEEATQIEQNGQNCEANFSRRVLRNDRIIDTVNNHEGQYKCPQCKRRFALMSNLIDHQVDHENASKPVRYECDMCNGTFSTKRNVKRHKETVHERLRPYECNVCHLSFGTRYTMTQHKKALHPPPNTPRIIVRRHGCPICGKMFTTKANVAYHHRRVHEKLMPFQCTICKRKFGCKAHLVRHQRCVHEQLKPFGCDECGRHFADRGGRNEHITAVHSDELPFRCAHCNRRFSTKRNLIGHTRGVHNNLREHQCSDCNKAYKRSQALIRHRILVHGKGMFYPCSDCDARCLGPVSLQHHRRTFHGKSDINRFAQELPKVEDLIGGEVVDLSDWNLEQMQRDIEQNHNGLDDGSLSTDSNLDEDLDYDSEQTLPPVQCSDNEISQESNVSDPVDWIIEVDNSTATNEPNEVEVTKTIVPTYVRLEDTLPTINGTRITYADERDHIDGRTAVVTPYLMAAQQRYGILAHNLAGWRVASLRIDKNEVYRVLSHMQSHSHLDSRNRCCEIGASTNTCFVERDACESTLSMSTRNSCFIFRPTVTMKSMRKCLGSFHLYKIARAPMRKRRVAGCNKKHLNVDSIGEDLARKLVVAAVPSLLPLPEVEQFEFEAVPSLLPLPEVEQFEFDANDAILPIGTT